jgi:hypothetical protein
MFLTMGREGDLGIRRNHACLLRRPAKGEKEAVNDSDLQLIVNTKVEDG